MAQSGGGSIRPAAPAPPLPSFSRTASFPEAVDLLRTVAGHAKRHLPGKRRSRRRPHQRLRFTLLPEDDQRPPCCSGCTDNDVEVYEDSTFSVVAAGDVIIGRRHFDDDDDDDVGAVHCPGCEALFAGGGNDGGLMTSENVGDDGRRDDDSGCPVGGRRRTKNSLMRWFKGCCGCCSGGAKSTKSSDDDHNGSNHRASGELVAASGGSLLPPTSGRGAVAGGGRGVNDWRRLRRFAFLCSILVGMIVASGGIVVGFVVWQGVTAGSRWRHRRPHTLPRSPPSLWNILFFPYVLYYLPFLPFLLVLSYPTLPYPTLCYPVQPCLM